MLRASLIYYFLLLLCIHGCHTANHDENENPPEAVPEQPQSPATLKALYAAIDAKDFINAQRITDELMTKSPGDFVLRFDKRENALFVAVKNNFIEFVTWVVEKYPNAKLGADASFHPDGDNALMLSLKNAQNNTQMADVASAILKHKTDGPLAVLNLNNQGYRPIHMAVWLNNLELVQALNDRNKSLKWSKAKVPGNATERTALELAKYLNYSSIIDVLGRISIDDLAAHGTDEERLNGYKNAKPEDKKTFAEKLLKQGLLDANEELLNKLFAEGVVSATTKIAADEIEKQVKEKTLSSDNHTQYANQELLEKMNKAQGTKDAPLKPQDLLRYALFDYSLHQARDPKAILALISKLTEVQPADLIFAFGAITNEAIILAMIDKIVLTSLSLIHKQDIMKEAIDFSSLPKVNSLDPIKKLVVKIPKILEIKLPLHTSSDDINIHPFDYALWIFDHQHGLRARRQFLTDMVSYFTIQGAPRVAESIPDVPEAKFKNIINGMYRNEPEATLLNEIRGIPNNKINHFELGHGTLLCNSVWNKMFTISNYLINVPTINLEILCQINCPFKHIIGAAIYELESACNHNSGFFTNARCVGLKEFILNLVVAKHLDEIDDINGKKHAILKLLIDLNPYDGANVALELINRRPTQKKDFGTDGMAKKYVKKLIKKVEGYPAPQKRGLQALKDLVLRL